MGVRVFKVRKFAFTSLCQDWLGLRNKLALADSGHLKSKKYYAEYRVYNHETDNCTQTKHQFVHTVVYTNLKFGCHI